MESIFFFDEEDTVIKYGIEGMKKKSSQMFPLSNLEGNQTIFSEESIGQSKQFQFWSSLTYNNSSQQPLQLREEPNKVQIQYKKRKGIKKRKRKNLTMKNHKETKNIIKNYGKELIKFILSNQQIVKKIDANNVKFLEMTQYLQERKLEIRKVVDLKDLWQNQKYGRTIRILSQVFLRKYSLSWIFNSRVQNIRPHIKYLKQIQQGVKNPLQFLQFDKF